MLSFFYLCCPDYWHPPTGPAVASHAAACRVDRSDGLPYPPLRCEVVPWSAIFSYISYIFIYFHTLCYHGCWLFGVCGCMWMFDDVCGFVNQIISNPSKSKQYAEKCWSICWIMFHRLSTTPPFTTPPLPKCASSWKILKSGRNEQKTHFFGFLDELWWIR